MRRRGVVEGKGIAAAKSAAADWETGRVDGEPTQALVRVARRLQAIVRV
jgi:hypothetical protein